MKSQKESLRLEEAGLTGDVLDSALSAFILEVVARHGEPSRRLCNKDPFTLKSGTYLKQLFPKSKFLFMVRDVRATVHTITDVDLSTVEGNQALVAATLDRAAAELQGDLAVARSVDDHENTATASRTLAKLQTVHHSPV
jgi:hypothetical protein